MTEHDEWRPFSWHCPNCGYIVTGYKNSSGQIKVECKRCKTVMFRTIKSRKHEIIDILISNNEKEK